VSNSFAFDSTYVYWSEWSGFQASTVRRAPLCGGSTQILATTMGFIAGVAVDAGNVYWVAQELGQILTMPVTGGSPAVVASGLTTPAGIAIRAGTIYLSDADGDVLSVPESGGKVTTLLQGPGLPPNTIVEDFSPSVVVDDSSVYFGQTYAPTPALAKVPLTGGPSTVLAPANPMGIAVDADNVYWADWAGTINEVPIGGGAVKVLASNQTVSAGPALDAYSVYWGTSEDTVTCVGCPPPANPGSNAVLKIAK
jgi:sugar lactone lactonase YvrE